MQVNFQPVGPRVLMRRDSVAETKTQSGIILPGDSKKKVDTATVVAVGTGSVRPDGSVNPCQFQVGDRVVFNHYAVTEMQVDGQMFIIANESDVFGRYVQQNG
jgi:chaperonin GroES